MQTGMGGNVGDNLPTFQSAAPRLHVAEGNVIFTMENVVTTLARKPNSIPFRARHEVCAAWRDAVQNTQGVSARNVSSESSCHRT